MNDMTARQEILLESGTNEMEIMEFYLGTQSFGINVHKLREIIPFDQSKVTVLPGSTDSMIGTILVRGHTLPLVDLNRHLKRQSQDQPEDEQRRIVLVCEFNRSVTGFLVDGVNQIHRISWKDVKPISTFIDQYRPRFTGSINVDSREVLVVDFEHILAEIDPEKAMPYDQVADSGAEEPSEGPTLAERRQSVRLMLAEDSAIIRSGILKVLTASGYSQMATFVDGNECYQAICRLVEKTNQAGEDINDHLNLVISDIEMPEMDGLTLCKKIKRELGLEQIPVLMFSSLITDQMIVKCDEVGADGYVSKPQIPELVQLLDKYCLGTSRT